jgi:hypothetical protein
MRIFVRQTSEDLFRTTFQSEVGMPLPLGTTRDYTERFSHRLAVLVLALVLMAVPACGDDDDDPGTTVTGQYDLTQLDGQDLPTTGEELGPGFTFSDGSITLDEDGGWTMSIEIEESAGAYNDQGTYTAEGSDIEFRSTTFGDDFGGTLVVGELQFNYDFDGEAGAESQLTFE